MNSTTTLLLELAWKSALVLVLPLAVARLAQRASASQRALILLLGLLSVGLLPVLRLRAPQLPLRWLPAEARKHATVNSLKAPEALSPPIAAALPVDTATAVTGESFAASTREAAPRGDGDWIAKSWALGTLVAGGYFVIGCLGLRGLRRRAQPATWPEIHGSIDARRTPLILESPECQIPVTWGWLRPVILFPADAARWPALRRRNALLHEMAHVRRGDWAAMWLIQAICAAYWWHPLVWLAASRWRDAVEQACDDLAMGDTVRPSDYAEDLLAIARQLTGGSHGPACAIVRKSALAQRLQYILENRTHRGPASATVKAAFISAAALGSIAAAGLTFAPANANETTGGEAASAQGAGKTGPSSEARDAQSRMSSNARAKGNQETSSPALAPEDLAGQAELRRELGDLMSSFKTLTEDVKNLRADVQKPEQNKETKDSKTKQLGEKIAELESIERDVREFERIRQRRVGEAGRLAWDDPDVMNDLAWSLVDMKGGIRYTDVQLASWSVQRANELAEGRDPKIIDTLARISSISGDINKAISLQNDAISKASGDLKAELSKRLTEYEERRDREKKAAENPQSGTPVEGKPGYIHSPYAPNAGYIDVRNIPSGSKIKDPFSGLTVVVP